AELRRRWAAVETNYQGRDFQLSLIKAGAQALSAAYELRHEIEKADRYAGIVREMQAFDIPYVPGELYASGYLAIRAPEASEPEIGMPGSAGKRAGRLAEYAMWERFTFHLVAVVLALLGGVLLLAPRLVRRDAGALPERLGRLLTIGDRMVLLIAGLAVPAAVYFGCTRLLPGRGEYLSFWKFLLMLSQAMGMVAAMAFLTAALARLILVRRGAALGFLKAGAKMDLVFASLSLGLIAIACFVPPALSPLYQEPYEGGFAGVMFAFPVLWAGFRTYGWIAAPPERRVLQAALLRACAPVMVVGALLSVLAIAELHAWENQLVSRMTTGSMTAPEMTLAAPSQQARADSCRRAILKTLDP
ncbi:MAG: hypothetical protein JWO82_1365, partial [Akkermansiaceae bacterium]|nr:hypothetical protein [Akkermansiaceae bacterium]